MFTVEEEEWQEVMVCKPFHGTFTHFCVVTVRDLDAGQWGVLAWVNS